MSAVVPSKRRVALRLCAPTTMSTENVQCTPETQTSTIQGRSSPCPMSTTLSGSALTPLPGSFRSTRLEDARRAMRAALAFVVVVFLSMAGVALPARAADDNENSTPTAWWIYTGQSLADHQVDAQCEASAHRRHRGRQPERLYRHLCEEQRRLRQSVVVLCRDRRRNGRRPTAGQQCAAVSLKAYDAGGGNLRFAVVMVANTRRRREEHGGGTTASRRTRSPHSRRRTMRG